MEGLAQREGQGVGGEEMDSFPAAVEAQESEEPKGTTVG